MLRIPTKSSLKFVSLESYIEVEDRIRMTREINDNKRNDGKRSSFDNKYL